MTIMKTRWIYIDYWGIYVYT